jgi:hypothetical protein
VFSFAGSATAVIEYVVVQNWGGGGSEDYHSTHFELYGSAGSDWTHLFGSDLAIDDAPQTFYLPMPTKVDALEFAIRTASLRSTSSSASSRRGATSRSRCRPAVRLRWPEHRRAIFELPPSTERDRRVQLAPRRLRMPGATRATTCAG